MAVKKLTEDEILDLYIETVGNPLDYSTDKDEMFALFTLLNGVDGFDAFLRDLIGEDVKNYWGAQTDVMRANVKGAARRAIYFRGILKKVREMQEIKTDLRKSK